MHITFSTSTVLCSIASFTQWRRRLPRKAPICSSGQLRGQYLAQEHLNTVSGGTRQSNLSSFSTNLTVHPPEVQYPRMWVSCLSSSPVCSSLSYPRCTPALLYHLDILLLVRVRRNDKLNTKGFHIRCKLSLCNLRWKGCITTGPHFHCRFSEAVRQIVGIGVSGGGREWWRGKKKGLRTVYNISRDINYLWSGYTVSNSSTTHTR